MGYDMYWRTEPTDVVAARDNDDWESADTLLDENFAYWRESIWTMQKFRALMDHLGVMGGEATNKPELETEGLIAWERFSSNDGWVITVEQCRMICDKLVAALEDDTGATIRAYTDGVEVGGSRDHTTGQLLLSKLLDTGSDIAISTGLTDNRDDDLMQAQSDLLSMVFFFEGAANRGNGITVW